MSGPRPTWRLFVAAHPPIEAVTAYLRALDAVDWPEHRPTPPGQVHLTLHFVGPVDARAVDEIADSVAHACAGVGAFELTPARLITLPERGVPRLAALECEPCPAASELHARLVRRLARSPKDRPGRDYRPHLTLCRFARGERPPRVDRPAEGLPAFRVGRVELVRSVLRPEGAEHRAVGEWALRG